MRRKTPLLLVLLVGFLGVVLLPGLCRAQRLQLQVESEQLYANLPFVLSVVASGFAESPEPRLSALQIQGCRVTPLGVTPNVSSMVQIINGQRSESRNVTFVYRFRIEAPQPGNYQIPALIAEQAGKSAGSRAVSFPVRGLGDTKDMQIRLQLPDRPVWVGETFDASLEWYLRRDVSNRSFVVPLFDQDDAVEVEPGPKSDQRLGGFHAGAKDLELPFSRDRATLDGVEYTRFRFLVRITPLKAGLLQAAPPRVVAALQTGMGQDAFGFPTATSSLFQAVGKPVRLDVRAPPQQGRPESYRNAIGSSFAIEVQAPRTVVRVGDPVELRILVRGRGRLQGLMLPDLNAAGLPAAEFSVPKDQAPGEILPDQKGKQFQVSVRLRSAAKQIPALDFAYFDPEKGVYQIARSQPIALSVQGSAVVGAGDVVQGGPQHPQQNTAAPVPQVVTAANSAPELLSALALGGADLALSAESDTLRRVRTPGELWPIFALLYLAPVVFLVRTVQRRRTAGAREQRRLGGEAMAQLSAALDQAADLPARESAPRVAAALRSLRRQVGGEVPQAGPLLERLDTEAYSPRAAHDPLDARLREQIREQAKGWLVAVLVVLAGLAALRPGTARADSPVANAAAAARLGYQEALAQKDPDRRREGFVRAEMLYREAATAQPDRPELLADWGNAALLAQDFGGAVLAYRRALRLDRGLSRARRNLSFVREHLPDWLPRPQEGGAADALLFWHRALGTTARHALAALGFAGAVMLLSWRRRALALVPALLFVAMALSLWQDRSEDADAVVLQPGVLRTADSLGAPPVLSRMVPAGAEVQRRERRQLGGDWTQIELADGMRGWLPSSTIEAVAGGPDR